MKIIVTRLIPEAGVKHLVNVFGRESVFARDEDSPMPRESLLKDAGGADAILCTITEKMDAAVMDAAGPSLKIIANMAVGYDNIALQDAAVRNICVTNTPGVLTEATADLAWALILGAARRVGEAERFLRAGRWEGWGPLQYLGMSLHGKTLGIFGMGRIGQAVARRGLGFGMSILYHDTQPIDRVTETSLGAAQVDKRTLLEQSDVISIHCPLTPETRHAFTLNELKQMKPTAILVNTARGPVVREADLCTALQRDIIFGAGLDVYEREPQIDFLLQQEERVLLLPHLGSATVETRTAMARMAAENIIEVLSGGAPLNPVTG